jgi:hypothetical protein
MIIKSHIRGGYRAAADYLKDVGKNEITRLVQISDPDAKNLDEAFHNMWTVASNSRVKKPLHHISINPFKDERLTDEQVQKIVARCEEKYGYKSGDHQRVIVEHILNGRQHFHVMWNRVSLKTGKAVWPGHHWKKSKQAAREMEKELGLKRPVPRRALRARATARTNSRARQAAGRYGDLGSVLLKPILPIRPEIRKEQANEPQQFRPQISGGAISGMCEAQRIDFVAACEGRITWRQYFDRWGDGPGLTMGPG